MNGRQIGRSSGEGAGPLLSQRGDWWRFGCGKPPTFDAHAVDTKRTGRRWPSSWQPFGARGNIRPGKKKKSEWMKPFEGRGKSGTRRGKRPVPREILAQWPQLHSFPNEWMKVAAGRVVLLVHSWPWPHAKCTEQRQFLDNCESFFFFWLKDPVSMATDCPFQRRPTCVDSFKCKVDLSFGVGFSFLFSRFRSVGSDNKSQVWTQRCHSFALLPNRNSRPKEEKVGANKNKFLTKISLAALSRTPVARFSHLTRCVHRKRWAWPALFCFVQWKANAHAARCLF